MMLHLHNPNAHRGRSSGAVWWASWGLVVVVGSCTGSPLPGAQSVRRASPNRIQQCQQHITRAVHETLARRFTVQMAAQRAPGVSARDVQAWVNSVDFAARSRAFSSQLMAALQRRVNAGPQDAHRQKKAAAACFHQNRCSGFARCLVRQSWLDLAHAPQWKVTLNALWRTLNVSSREQLHIHAVSPVSKGPRIGPHGRSPMSRYQPDPKVYSKKADPRKIITTKGGSRILGNMIVLLLKRGQRRSVAEAIAHRVGGKIVGQIPRFDMYQLQVPTATQAALDAKIAKVRKDPRVYTAGYDLIVELR